LITGGVTGYLYYMATESLNRHLRETGEGRIERIDTYCAAVQSWQTGTANELDNFVFSARLGAAGHEVPCSISSVPNAYDKNVSQRSDGKCSDYEVKTVRCNVSELIPSPVFDSLYTIELVGKEPGRAFSRTIGQAVVQVLTERVWDLIDSDYVSSKCGMGADFDCPRRNRQRNCDDLEGQPLDEDVKQCTARHRLASASHEMAPCWVMKPSMEAQKTFAFVDMQWPQPHESVNPVTSDYLFRCTHGVDDSGQKVIQHMTGTSLEMSETAMLEILDEAELTFRHYQDPYVVASKLTDSTFDLGAPQDSSLVLIIFVFMWAACGTCCWCSFTCKAAIAACPSDDTETGSA
ncbi:unnamed protein product, partial [Symbiodinium pilosum]